MRATWLLFALAWAMALPARAQDGASPTTDPQSGPQPADTAVTPEANTEAPAAAAAPAGPPPVAIVVLPTGRVPTETVDAMRTALSTQIESMAGGRRVSPVTPEAQAAFAACSDAPCVGAQVASVGAIGAVIARLSRRAARGPIELRIDMVDPVSGTPRVPTVLYSLNEGAPVAESIAPLVEQLRASMFSPPPPPPQLLVTVNVDGALVRIDDGAVGESPIAPQRLEPGHHVISVSRDGYMMTRREVDLELGESERVDITLQSYQAAGIDPSTVASGGMAPTSSEPPWYEHWGFWTGVGGGLIVIGVVIGVSVAVTSNQGPPPDPMGVRLPPIH